MIHRVLFLLALAGLSFSVRAETSTVSLNALLDRVTTSQDFMAVGAATTVATRARAHERGRVLDDVTLGVNYAAGEAGNTREWEANVGAEIRLGRDKGLASELSRLEAMVGKASLRLLEQERKRLAADIFFRAVTASKRAEVLHRHAERLQRLEQLLKHAAASGNADSMAAASVRLMAAKARRDGMGELARFRGLLRVLNERFRARLPDDYRVFANVELALGRKLEPKSFPGIARMRLAAHLDERRTLYEANQYELGAFVGAGRDLEGGKSFYSAGFVLPVGIGYTSQSRSVAARSEATAKEREAAAQEATLQSDTDVMVSRLAWARERLVQQEDHIRSIMPLLEQAMKVRARGLTDATVVSDLSEQAFVAEWDGISTREEIVHIEVALAARLGVL